jgi:DNA-binding IclR family transcriptional regulator
MAIADTRRTAVTEPTTSVVARTVRLLAALAESPGDTSIQALAAKVKLAPSTVHRLLEQLGAEGFVEHDSRLRLYRAGPAFLRIAGLVSSGRDIGSQASPFLQFLANRTSETALLALLDRASDTMFFANLVQARDALGYNVTLHVPLPLLWGATSKAILAFMPDEEVERIRKEAQPAPGSHSPVPTSPALFAELVQIREVGYARSHDEKLAGASSVAAPVFAANHTIVGSLALSVPTFRATDEWMGELGPLVREQARGLSLILGG